MNERAEAGVSSSRLRVLTRIYQVFDDWSAGSAFVCRQGCAVCCTHGVTISETEGERIIDRISKDGRQAWLADQLSRLPPKRLPTCTTNEFAGACLRGEDLDPGGNAFAGVCPFLRENLCTIYPVRPFSCRSFVSSITCQPHREAVLPSSFLSAGTAVSQLIEHLDQGRYWGNMLNMLRRLTGRQAAQRHPADGLLIARPLPGFLIADEDYPQVAPLLEDIFAATVNGKTLRDLLNGR